MAETLLIAASAAECENLAAFGQSLGGAYDILGLGLTPPPDCGAEKTFSIAGEPPPADSLAQALSSIAQAYALVAGVATMFGKDYLPRLAGLLDRPMVSDIVAVNGPKSFSRPMFAGNIIAEVQVDSPKFIASIRGTAFTNPRREGSSPNENLELVFQGTAKRVSVSKSEGGRPDLTQARVVVSGGRPLKDAETFEKLIGGLADALGGAAGATRAAVDSGIAPNELQVGQTGKIVAPDLYIAAGVSGSTQHMAGMKDSKIIVAINTDPEAPIFEIADFGLVMDLYQAIPELIQKAKQ